MQQPLKKQVRKNRSQEVSFKDRVLRVVRNIPKGKTLTYKEVAVMADSPGAHRAVGSIMSRNFDETVPCHRVVKSDGSLGDYNRGGESRKKEILKKEKAL